MTPKQRAARATALFTLFGALAAIFLVHDWRAEWPLALVYALNLYNTYFSIEHFSGIIPPSASSQQLVDTLLVCLYAIVALSMGFPLLFMLALTLLMAVAVLKYVVALPVIKNPELLHRKINIDTAGAAGALVTVMGIIAGYERGFVFLFTAVFVVATVYILFINPLYVLKREI